MGNSEETNKRDLDMERDQKGRFLPQHGAYTGHVRRKYRDKRTKEGKQLQAVMDSLVDDLGGHDNLNAGQRLLLDTIQSKLIVILQVSQYVDQQSEIIRGGELLPVLGKSYLAYLNALRLSLAELYKNYNGGKGRVPSIAEIINEAEGKQ
jgi:hypothetical protein